MNILLINATKRKQITYNIAKECINNLNAKEVKELFLPDALPEFCCGCGSCFIKGETFCPHYKYTKEILDLLEWADLYIFAAPVYVYHIPGQLKTFLDHFGFIWLVHRPRPFMFKKKALIISTAAGAGMKSTIKDIRDSLEFWGVGRIFSYGEASYSISYNELSQKKKNSFSKNIKKYTKKLQKNYKKPSLKIRNKFKIFQTMQKIKPLNELDNKYWIETGLIKNNKPF